MAIFETNPVNVSWLFTPEGITFSKTGDKALQIIIGGVIVTEPTSIGEKLFSDAIRFYVYLCWFCDRALNRCKTCHGRFSHINDSASSRHPKSIEVNNAKLSCCLAIGCLKCNLRQFMTLTFKFPSGTYKSIRLEVVYLPSYPIIVQSHVPFLSIAQDIAENLMERTTEKPKTEKMVEKPETMKTAEKPETVKTAEKPENRDPRTHKTMTRDMIVDSFIKDNSNSVLVDTKPLKEFEDLQSSVEYLEHGCGNLFGNNFLGKIAKSGKMDAIEKMLESQKIIHPMVLGVVLDNMLEGGTALTDEQKNALNHHMSFNAVTDKEEFCMLKSVKPVNEELDKITITNAMIGDVVAKMYGGPVNLHESDEDEDEDEEDEDEQPKMWGWYSQKMHNVESRLSDLKIGPQFQDNIGYGHPYVPYMLKGGGDKVLVTIINEGPTPIDPYQGRVPDVVLVGEVVYWMGYKQDA
jgi:hypothetical protein